MGRFYFGLFAHRVIVTIVCILEGLAVDPAGRDVLDIIQSINATSANSLSGLRLTTGPNNSTPALLLEASNRHIAVPRALTQRALRLLQDHSDITFLCSVRQDLGATGTILAISSESSRFLEIESDRRDEIRFHYTHNGQTIVETFPYRLADGRWHQLAVSLSADQISVFVDCNRIYQRMILSPDRTPASTAGPLSLYVGQRNGQHALFRGALQDVKIVTQAHGYLLQCPQQDTECPTCVKFHDLEQRVQEMSTLYKELTLKLMKAEERLSGLEQCECLKYCYDNGTQRQEGEEWKKDSCNTCRCRNGTIECFQEECPHCSNPIYRDGECCPVCQTTCYYSGKYYDHGESTNPAVCVTCTCVNAVMECNQLDVKKQCPPLNCPESERISVHGECCPVCKGKDYCALGHDCHNNASCVNLATMYACHCQAGYDGDGRHCQDIDECKVSGGPKGHHCSANTVCINTPGSYRCDCIKGHSFQDSECKDIDECLHGIHQCHQDAQCVNVKGTYTCSCNDGFSGDGFSCQPFCPGDCRNGGKCIAPSVCECRHGYIGSNCELDIDECDLGISRCHDNSVCVNMPGWYHCDCLDGYHSSWPDNHYGTLCLDVNECSGEGGGHTCHPTMECVNTEGRYHCRCSQNAPCNKGCVYEGSEHYDNTYWRSKKDSCRECRCEAGRTVCHQTSCDCADPTVDLKCCPSCDNTSACPHQEFMVRQRSGDSWFYQCQRCECKRGDTNCRPVNCPKLSCQNAIQRPGDCCPVCAENPCESGVQETGGQDLSQLSCTYMGVKYSHGEGWSLKADPCASCQCKAGHICCSVSQNCSTLK